MFEHLPPLTPAQRRFVVEHERLHLEYARLRGTISPERAEETERALRAFELGAAAADPKPTPWDLATDLAIQDVLKGAK